MASGARTLRKTPSISRVGNTACGKGVSHGVFLDSWVGEGDQCSRSGGCGERWGVCSAAQVAVGPLATSPASLCTAVMGDTEAGVAGTRDAESGVPSATCLGCKRDKNAAVWARSRKVMKGESLGLQAQCLPQPWEHALEGIHCEPAALSLAGR